MTLPAQASAEDDDAAARVAGELGYDVTAEGAHLVSKVWPADPSKTIVALAFPSEANEGGEGAYDLDVLIVDSATSAVRARYTEEGAIASDAIRFVALAIDTAPYRVAKGVRAFGVRLTYLGSSSVNPYGATVIELFVESGRKLRRLLHSLTVSTDGGEWDGSCAGSFTETRRTIGIGKTSSRGLQDLVIEGEVTKRTNRLDGDECAAEEKTGKPERYVLKYDGKAYGVPAALSFE